MGALGLSSFEKTVVKRDKRNILYVAPNIIFQNRKVLLEIVYSSNAVTIATTTSIINFKTKKTCKVHSNFFKTVSYCAESALETI